jgi:hypothetical protein
MVSNRIFIVDLPAGDKKSGAASAAPHTSMAYFFVLLLEPLLPELPLEPLDPLLPLSPELPVLPLEPLLPELPPLMVWPALPIPLEPARLLEPLCPVEP